MIHCFNHRVEVALEDAFRTTSFKKVDSMSCKFYYLHENSPKHSNELRELSEAYGKAVPKPSKTTGTCWREHKYQAMILFLKHFGPYISNLNDSTDSFASPKTNSDLRSCRNGSMPILSRI